MEDMDGRRQSAYDHEILELRAQKEQLQIELNTEPMRVSDAIQDLMKYMEENKEEDKMVSGFPNKKENPYEEKGGCTIM